MVEEEKAEKYGFSENSQENQDKLDETFNLEDTNDREKLEEEIASGSQYFKPDSDVTYKIKLTSPHVRKVEKEFDGEKITKYQIGISAKGKDGSEFEGIWEVGKQVINPIFKNYQGEDTEFLVSKTGKGTNTRYSVNLKEDF